MLYTPGDASKDVKDDNILEFSVNYILGQLPKCSFSANVGCDP